MSNFKARAETHSLRAQKEKSMSKKSFIDSIEVKNPCPQSWNEMVGGDEIRFCSHCAKDVHNLSKFTRREAKKLIAKSNGGICVQYVRRPDGRIQTAEQQLYKIVGRASRLAAGVFGASLSLSVAVSAQALYAKTELPSAADAVQKFDENSETKTEGGAGAIEITVKDPQGALVPNVSVIVKNSKTDESQTLISNDEGFLQLQNTAAGIYEISTDAANGFSAAKYENVAITDGQTTALGVELAISGELMTMGGAIAVSYENPLVQAATEDDLESVRQLIKEGADVNAKEEDKMTALHAAVENGNVEIVRELLQAGAKVNARAESRRTPLMMLDNDATPELVRVLITHGAKIDSSDDEKSTVLINAANFNASSEVLHMLIEYGAEIDSQNDDGRTALMEAAFAENFESVKAILEAGADINLRDKENKTAFNLTDSDEIKELLVSYGAVKETDDTSDKQQNVKN